MQRNIKAFDSNTSNNSVDHLYASLTVGLDNAINALPVNIRRGTDTRILRLIQDAPDLVTELNRLSNAINFFTRMKNSGLSGQINLSPQAKENLLRRLNLDPYSPKYELLGRIIDTLGRDFNLDRVLN
ncbi:MAG: hypothetical protein LBD99_04340, partial [Candidatus Margulisbacteria bacterium]|nr:hypothetical protein [Candidatus Margulisiibacteriota bacterium]